MPIRLRMSVIVHCGAQGLCRGLKVEQSTAKVVRSCC